MKKMTFLYILMVSLIAFANTDVVILDVRTPEEYSQKHVKNSMNYDVKNESFEKNIANLDKTKTYKIYCKSGGRASKALSIMKSLGFKNLENLGGLEDAVKTLKAETATGTN